MTRIRLGLRYERLLVFAAPLSFATLIVLFIAVASVTQKEQYNSRCFELAADVLTKQQDALRLSWDQHNSNGPQPPRSYKLELELAWIDGGLHSVLGRECYKMIDHQIGQTPPLSPADMISKFQAEAKVLGSTPVQFYDVEIPEKATVSILGTDVKIGLMTFTRTVQMALAPLLLLWLGSLYTTRLRESLLISSASTLAEVFPHSVNVYATGRFPELRKRNMFLYHLPKFVALQYGFLRLASLSVFVFPPVVSYILSLYFLHSQQYTVIFAVLGLVVIIATLLNIILELCPWHYWKIFSDPAHSSGHTSIR